MNKWIKKTYEMVENTNYLDKLLSVYPIMEHEKRELDSQLWNGFQTLYNSKDKDYNAILDKLFEFDLFPIKNSYVSLIRNDKSKMHSNPKVVKRIVEEVLSMSLSEIENRLRVPKENNRTMGSHFQNYVKNCNFSSDTMVLKEGDAKLKKYAESNLGYNRNKGLDFIAQKNGVHYIGEAKLLTTDGGNQNHQLKDAFALLDCELSSSVERVLFLDGVIWLKNSGRMYNKIVKNQNCNIMSALLLEEFMLEHDTSSNNSTPFLNLTDTSFLR